jgi:hypothetical protein
MRTSKILVFNESMLPNSMAAAIIIVISIVLIFMQLGLNAQESQLSPLSKVMVDDDSKFTTAGNIGITITNYGTFGDGFVEQSPIDQPSCEYPKGSGIEHLFVGGLWVGGKTPSGTRVTTGAFNVPRLGGVNANFEFTNTASMTDRVVEASSLEDDKYYSPDATSHQDFICDFSDTNLTVPGTSITIPYHQPLGIAVHLETYAWNYPFADAFVIFNYTIKNVGYSARKDTLKDVYVGMWADLVVRNTNITPPRVGSPFYLYAGIGYTTNDSLQLVYCYDHSGDRGYSNSYVAMAFLGADPVNVDHLYDRKTTHQWWLFSGGDTDEDRAPSDEASRYARMESSITDDYFRASLYQKPGNRMSLISTGPFETIPPDSSINIVFAIVCGKEYGSDNDDPTRRDSERVKKILYENASWAYRAYYGEDTNRNGILDYVGTDSTEDIIPNGVLDRYILPTPPAPPRLKAIPEDGKVTLYWDLRSQESVDLISKLKDFEGYRIYRSFLGDDRSPGGILSNMQLIREYDIKDKLFYDTGLDSITMASPIVEAETDPETGLQDTIYYQYKLELDNLHNGWQYAFAISAFDSGDLRINLPSLESSKLENVVIITPGTTPLKAADQRKVGVYPNPYRAGAIWDGGYERERKIVFFNLPAHCEVRIYTLAGDLVDQFTHRAEAYDGREIKWYREYSPTDKPTIFSGGEHAWDLISKSDQALASGLYLFTVKDQDSGEVYRGKFVVIK